MRIILLRHAESKSNKENRADSQIDSGLSKKGNEDARRLISKLRKYKIEVFIVSPLKRTLDTINPFLNTLKTKPQIIKSELTYERDLGDFTGSKMGDFQKYCEDNNLNKVITRPKNGESILDTYKRARKFLSFLKKRYSDKTVLVCGHKNFLLCLEIAITNKEIRDYYSYPSLKTGELKELELN